MNVEDTKDPVYKEFCYEVLDLVRVIEGHQKEVERVKKLTTTVLAIENKKPVKEFMCPLMEKCPDFQADRWPMSNAKGNQILGKKCELAHHPYELYFEAQKHNKEKYLKHLDEVVTENLKKGTLTNTNKHFKHAGSIPTDVYGLKKIGGPDDLNIKEKKPAAQNTGETGDKKGEANQEFREKLKKSKKVKDKVESMRIDDDYMRRKLGYLRRSETLYHKERYKEAFDTIIKAIRIVKKEDEIDEKVEEERKTKLREKLGLDDGKKIL